MRKAATIVAASFGILTGIAGLEHDYFFNDFLKSIIYFGLLVILTSLPLSVYAAYSCDATSWV
jgi:hypothetical protein